MSGLLCLVVLSGCRVHKPDRNVPPAVPAQDTYRERPDVFTTFPEEDWWRGFEDPNLNALVEEALQSNLQLLQLVARIEQANALVRQAGGRLLPQLDGVGDYESRWTDLDDSAKRSREESSTVGGLLTWEIDVWGRLRSAQRAQAMESDAAIHDFQGGRLLLSAIVAETYFEILEQRQQRTLITGQINANQTLLDLTRLRFGQAQSSIVDVLQQQEQLDSTLALVPDVEARLQQLEYSMDVLLGRAPGSRERIQEATLQLPPPMADVGVPSDLLEQRPDLRAARDRVVAVDYRVGEAIADRLPRFFIGGSLTAGGSPGLDTLAGSLLASAIGPIYDAGTRKAEVDRQRAVLRERVAEFSDTYLAAVRDVEVALLREHSQKELVTLLDNQLVTARRLLNETRNRYSQGLTDYLPVLAALTRSQNLERELLTRRRELLSFRVALHRALGGPMLTARDPAQQEARR